MVEELSRHSGPDSAPARARRWEPPAALTSRLSTAGRVLPAGLVLIAVGAAGAHLWDGRQQRTRQASAVVVAAGAGEFTSSGALNPAHVLAVGQLTLRNLGPLPVRARAVLAAAAPAGQPVPRDPVQIPPGTTAQLPTVLNLTCQNLLGEPVVGVIDVRTADGHTRRTQLPVSITGTGWEQALRASCGTTANSG